MSRFVDDPSFSYQDFQDFAATGDRSGLATFRYGEFSWQEHGFLLVDRLYTELAELLDIKFTTAQNLTYHTYDLLSVKVQ